MPFVTENFDDYANKLPTHGALLALDLGTKTIGLAVTDMNRIIASPLQTLNRAKFSAALSDFERIVQEKSVVGLIVGYPRHMDGSLGARTQSSKAYASQLSHALKMPVLLWDERLSTSAVQHAMIEADLSRKRQSEVVDKMAAAYILQGVLERFHQ